MAFKSVKGKKGAKSKNGKGVEKDALKIKEKKDIEKTITIGGSQFDIALSKRMYVLLITVGISLVLLTLGYLVSGGREFVGVLANLILLCTFIIAVPQFLFTYRQFKSVKEMEERFPALLRDIIESLTAGLPLHQAMINVSKMDYGKLTPEVKRAANQITWGVPVTRVLNQMADRLKSSKRLYTSIKLINESYTSGGDVISILDTVANNSNLLEDAEKERKALLNQYVLLMYAICIMFIIIVVAISRLIMPIFESTAGGSEEAGEFLGLGNPCDTCSMVECIPCGLYEATSYYLFSIESDNIASYYVSLFFYMSVVQAIFSGLVAGQIGENSVTAGVKHSLIMVSITMGTFYFMIYFKVLAF
jgi:flagellar protein FlaJ